VARYALDFVPPGRYSTTPAGGLGPRMVSRCAVPGGSRRTPGVGRTPPAPSGPKAARRPTTHRTKEPWPTVACSDRRAHGRRRAGQRRPWTGLANGLVPSMDSTRRWRETWPCEPAVASSVAAAAAHAALAGGPVGGLEDPPPKNTTPPTVARPSGYAGVVAEDDEVVACPANRHGLGAGNVTLAGGPRPARQC